MKIIKKIYLFFINLVNNQNGRINRIQCEIK